MAFDPDAYLQSKQPFDPDAYIAAKAPVTPAAPEQAFDVKGQAQKFLPPFSQLGMKAMNLFQRAADKGGEVTAEALASGVTPKVNPIFPAPFNVSMEQTPGRGLRTPPTVAAGIGTAVQMAPDLASMAVPMMAGEAIAGKSGQKLAEEGPNFLQRIGAQSLNKSAGIQPGTVMKLAGRGNPAEVGTELGQALYREGATGLTPGGTFEKATAVKQQYGQAVGDALDAIHKAGGNVVTDAKTALKPILDKWAELGDATLSQNRVMARPFAEVYSKLEKIANAKGGTLGIDDIQTEMEQVGKLFNRISKTSDKYPALSELYGTLADTRDGIVQNIAERAGNPELTAKLLEANKGFSRYSRIMSDISKAAAKEGAGTSTFSAAHPIKSVIDSMRPALSKGALFVGDLLSSNPAQLGKYAPALMAEAAKGPQNFESLHNALLESEPAYISLFKAAQSAPKSIFKKVADNRNPKVIEKNGRRYAWVPGPEGSMIELDREAPRPLFENRKRVGAKVIAAARG